MNKSIFVQMLVAASRISSNGARFLIEEENCFSYLSELRVESDEDRLLELVVDL